MKASDFILKVQQEIDQHGDLEIFVEYEDKMGGYYALSEPSIEVQNVVTNMHRETVPTMVSSAPGTDTRKAITLS